MSKAVYIQTTPAQKLPYLHSKFKPSSKFAKSFGGCSRFSKLRQSLPQDDAELTSRLPRITYNAQDIRETPPTFGSLRRGARREYPGFTGQARILRNRKKSETTSQITNGNHSFSTSSQSEDGDKNLVYASTREHKEPASCLSGLNDTNPRDSNPNYDWSRLQDSARKRRDLRLNNAPKQNQTHSGQDSNSTAFGLLSDMDSLFIYDDDADPEHKTDSHDQMQKPDVIDSSSREYGYKDKDPLVQFSLLDNNDSSKDDEEVKNDPFAKNFEEKLREIRGKSGMKRDKTRKRLQGKKGDVEMRPLGDVITNKRLQELLLPQNAQGVTIRLHS